MNRAPLVLLVVAAGARLFAAESAAPLKSIAQVRSLQPAEAAKGLPVLLRGTVTYCDPDWKVLFLQDGQQSVFVEHSAATENGMFGVHRGQLVELKGRTTADNICGESVQTFGERPLPLPLELTGKKLLSSDAESRWIKTRGWIASLKTLGGATLLELVIYQGKSVSLVLPKVDLQTTTTLQGWWVEVTGVLAPKTDAEGRRTSDYYVFLSDLDQVHVVKPLPAYAIADLLKRLGGMSSDEPICLHGAVEAHHLGDHLVVKDQTGTLKVEFDAPTYFSQGTSLEIYGYPRSTNRTVVLANAVLRLSASPRAAGPEPQVPTPLVAATDLPLLTKVAQVRSLSVLEAARGYPVRVTGVLTYCDTPSFRQFIQDDSAGIYLNLIGWQADVRMSFGQRVEISGFSGPGDYAPVIHVRGVRSLGPGAVPTAKSVTIPALMTGAEDSQWVSLKAVVRNVTLRTNQAILTLNADDTEIRASVPDPAIPGNLVDTLVQVQGVCTTIFGEHRRLQGVELQVPGWAQVQVSERSADNPFALPVSPITDLFKFHSGINGVHRVRVAGSVVLCLRDGSFFVQDGSGGILVQPGETAASVQVGSAVEIVGFPSVAEKVPALQEALVKPLESGVPLAPVALESETPLSPDWHGKLVRLEARVLSTSRRASQEFLLVQFGRHVIDAILERTSKRDSLLELPAGSRVSLTGVYVARLDDRQNVRTFQLLLRTPADITLVWSPSWWTASNTLWVLGSLASVLVLVLVWVRSLRRQVYQRTQQLRQEIEERKRTQETLVHASRLAGMAEVATSVLHNVGNVLNSINVSTNLLSDRVRHSKAANLTKAVELMREHDSNLTEFLSEDPKGRQLPAYLGQLAQHLVQEQHSLGEELKCLSRNVEHVKSIVAMQQTYAKVAGVAETVRACDLVEDALRFNEGALARHEVHVVRQYDSHGPVVTVDKHKVLQILVNLIRNAKYACDEANRHDRCVTVGILNGNGRVRVTVADNGVGIPSENLTRIFTMGFTTRKDGHGFGLHSSALAAREMGGQLLAQSDGPGRGAVFTLDIPLSPKG